MMSIRIETRIAVNKLTTFAIFRKRTFSEMT